MPRGVYDRSKMKAKKTGTAGMQTASTTTPATKTAGKRGRRAAATTTSYGQGPSTSTSLSSINELHSHLQQLTRTRVELSGQNIAHNTNLLSTIDSEIAATIGSFRNWRETQFPEPAKMERQTAEMVSTSVAQATAPAQPAAPQATPPAPLPFTPGQVGQHIREGGQA